MIEDYFYLEAIDNNEDYNFQVYHFDDIDSEDLNDDDADCYCE